MNTQQLLMLGLVVVIGAVAGVTLYDRMHTPPPGTTTPEAAVELSIRSTERTPEGWDLSAVPEAGPAVRTFTTEKGVQVQVLSEGRGAAVRLGRPVDLRVELYLLNGVKVENTVARGFVFGQRRPGREGFMEGLAGIRPYERRRILVPNELAHGARTVGQVPPHADLVYDVRWIPFELTDLRVGSGKEAKENARVQVFYRGSLEDGTVFDQTKEGEPATFQLRRGAVIDGFRLGIQGMREGGERRIWIPSHMGYGETGKGRKIQPHANLVFVVELLRVLD